VAVLGLLVCTGTLHAATRYDPRLRFRQIGTPHFVIYFHQGEEALARRLAAIAERVHTDLGVRFGLTPGGRTHVVLVDQNDLPNGFATPLPYNIIGISATQPTGVSSIANTDDWLALVFVHEYTHILHLGQSRGWSRLARGLFGRSVISMPNLSLPLWQIEGLATLAESSGGQGRLHAGDFEAIVTEASAASRFEPIDRVSGGLVDWPSGAGWYAYGAFFHEFLLERYGADKLRDLVTRTSGRVHYLTSPVFKQVYGKSLGSLWREFRVAREQEAVPPSTSGVTRLTTFGYEVHGARQTPDGLVFSVYDPRGFPAIYRLGRGGAPSHVTTRFGGTQLASHDGRVYFDQLEFVRGTALQSDLYVADVTTGRTRRLTRHARVTEPDVSRDGSRLAMVQIGEGRRDLVLIDLATLQADSPVDAAALPVTRRWSAPETTWANPRWSPDGQRLVAERRALHGRSELVLVDTTSGACKVLTAAGRNVTPTWTPDGSAILFASDRAGGPFNLYRIQLTDGATTRLTQLSGGAQSPLVADDGQSVVFVGYTIAGWDLFSMPLERGVGTFPSPAEPLRSKPGGEIVETPFPGPAQKYRPWSTLLPRGWLPIVEDQDDEVRIGAIVTGSDILGRHVYGATASWPVAPSADYDRVRPRGRPKLVASYVYDRWQPQVFVAYSDETSLFRATQGPAAIPAASREQVIDTGVVLPFRRIRWAQSVLAAWHWERAQTNLPDEEAVAHRDGLRAAWAFNSARVYGYSISREAGVTAGSNTEVIRPAFGADGRATSVVGDLRGYLPLWPRHAVVAIRIAGATSDGDPGVRRLYRMGGSSGNAAIAPFGDEPASLMRGYPTGSIRGHHVALVNAEYRLPLWYPQRGWGTLPVFVRSLHAAGFVDVGNAWLASSRPEGWKTSVGGEVSGDLTIAYGLPDTWTLGVAWGHDASGRLAPNRELYFRVGWSF
jgi:WD40-like Beta Propeller Repeat